MLNNRLDESTSNNLFYVECSIGKSEKHVFIHMSFASIDTANRLFKKMKDEWQLQVAIYGNRIVVFPSIPMDRGINCDFFRNILINFSANEHAQEFLEFAMPTINYHYCLKKIPVMVRTDNYIYIGKIDSLISDFSFEKRIAQTENVNHAVLSLFLLSQALMTTPLNNDIVGIIKAMFVLLDMSPDLKKQIELSRQFLFYTQSPPFFKKDNCIGNTFLEITTPDIVCYPDIDISCKHKNTMGFPKPHVTFDTFGLIKWKKWQYDETKEIIIQSCSSHYAAMHYYQKNNVKPLVSIFTDGFTSGGLTLNGILAASNAPYAMPKDLGDGLVQSFGGLYLISNAEIKVDEKTTPVDFAFVALPNLDQPCEADYFDRHGYIRHVTTLMIMQFQLAKSMNKVLMIDREGCDLVENKDEDIAAIIHAVKNIPEFRSVEVIIALGDGIKDSYTNPLKDRINEVEKCIPLIRYATQLDLNSLSHDLKKRYAHGVAMANNSQLKALEEKVVQRRFF